MICDSKSPAVLFFSERSLEAFLRAAGMATLKEAGVVASRTLADSGDPILAARNLFRMLRELDASDGQLIVAEPPPDDDGISHAIRDRLTRAARRLPGPSRR